MQLLTHKYSQLRKLNEVKRGFVLHKLLYISNLSNKSKQMKRNENCVSRCHRLSSIFPNWPIENEYDTVSIFLYLCTQFAHKNKETRKTKENDYQSFLD